MGAEREFCFNNFFGSEFCYMIVMLDSSDACILLTFFSRCATLLNVFLIISVSSNLGSQNCLRLGSHS